MLYIMFRRDARAESLRALAGIFVSYSRDILYYDIHDCTYKLCIVDITEIDTCALKLKGLVLFGIDRLTTSAQFLDNYDGNIILKEHDVFMDWWHRN